jgi:hypothetical protein
MPFSIQETMAKFLWMMIAIAGCVQAQVAAPAASTAASSARSPLQSHGTGAPPVVPIADELPSTPTLGGKVGLVRGVVKRLDPIHDQLLLHAFGGGDIRIAFDARTQLVSENPGTRLISIPAGSVVSVDTVIDQGKLFARSVRTGASEAVELNGQVVRYDAAKSQLTLRDPMSPQNISLRITSGTMVANRGQSGSPQALVPGMLVRVEFSPKQKAATNVEILAAPGNSFIFEGRIVSVDLRSRVLALSNDSDQSIRELDLGSLGPIGMSLLREGADVSIQAEFDGGRYNVRTVSLVASTP